MNLNKPHYDVSSDGGSFTLYRADHTPGNTQTPPPAVSMNSGTKIWGKYTSLQELQKASRNLFGELAMNAKDISLDETSQVLT